MHSILCWLDITSLVHVGSTRVSWFIANAKCLELNSTLPHLEDANNLQLTHTEFWLQNREGQWMWAQGGKC